MLARSLPNTTVRRATSRCVRWDCLVPARFATGPPHNPTVNGLAELHARHGINHSWHDVQTFFPDGILENVACRGLESKCLLFVPFLKEMPTCAKDAVELVTVSHTGRELG
jgi:hypothetical protein